MLQLIAIFKENGWNVTFASPAQESPFMADLKTLNVGVQSILLNSDTFDNYIRDLAPTIVLFDRFMVEEQFGWRVAANCPTALRVLDTEDLHCLRLSRQKSFKANRQATNEDLLTEVIAKREIASIYRCDISLIISEIEIDILKNVFKIDASLLHYLPLFSDTHTIAKSVLSFEKRQHFAFIGNFHHEPNVDAVEYLKKDLWPLINKQLPDARLLIYGAYLPQKIMQYNTDSFVIMGRAEDARIAIGNARVLLAPLRFGAGLKGKLIEAMSVGTASVTTSIGEEGISGGMPWNGAIADDTETFVNAAVRLYQDIDLWIAVQQNGFEILSVRFSKDKFAPNFISTILTTRAQIESHRQRNFIGSMLLHHTMASTKYMSKWIEAKNKA